MTAQETSMRAAIVGAGNIGGTHASAYRAAGVTIVAVCDVDMARAEALAQPHGAHSYDSVAAMLAAETPGVVSICTPPAQHRDAALEVLAHGIPILCEKPLAESVQSARAIVEAAQERGVPCMTGFCHRFHEPIMQIKERIDAGEIGKPVLFRNRFAYRFAGVENSWFSNPSISGGGTLMDTSVHSIDLYRFLIGDITQVAAQLTTSMPGLQVEDDSVLLVNGPARVPGVIEASWTTPVGGSIVTIFGTEGNVTVNYDLGDFGLAFIQRAGEEHPTEIPRSGTDRFTEEVRHFITCIERGTAVSPDAMDGLRTLQVVEAASRAASSGGAAEVEM
jgi:predicted dehydrogenase